MPSEIFFYSEDVDFSIKNPSGIASWLNKTIVSEGKKAGEISVIFCSDEYLLDMNQKHLQHDYYTDIITFGLSEKNQPIEAEIYISIDRVKENASNLSIAYQQEMLRVLFHGALHLCGYKDKSKADIKLMRGKEDFYIGLYNKQNPQ
jgi:rRNA maturation RNase YbeY